VPDTRVLDELQPVRILGVEGVRLSRKSRMYFAGT